MAVLPLITEGSKRNVVEREAEFEAAGGLNGQVLLIQGLDREQLNSKNDTNVSYDFRVGSEYRDHRDLGKKELPEGGVIKLLPGAAVIIETEEWVHFPKCTFGHIVPKVSLLQKGISNTSSKIDPGYNGKLIITVFNLGKKVVELNRRERFCTLYVLQVQGEARPYDKPSKRIVSGAIGGKLQRARDLLEANTGLVMIVLIIFTLILAILQIIGFYIK